MLDKHNHLFLRDEALEVGPGLFLIDGLELGCGSILEDANRQRKQVSHQMALAGQLDLYGAITEATRSSLTHVHVVPLHGPHGIFKSAKLDIGVHSLASHPFHDDMNRLVSVIEDTRVAPQESDYFSSLRGEGNLYTSLLISRVR